MTWLLVIAGGMIGAALRYLADRAIHTRTRSVFPWGTLGVNLAGCLILGLLAGVLSAQPASSHLHTLLGTGFCGALSTYSTFSYETLRLAQNGARLLAIANTIGNLVAGVGAVGLGAALAEAIWT